MGGPGPPTVGMIDVGSADEDRSHQSQDLSTRPGSANPTDQAHLLVHQRLEAEAHHQRHRQDQPGIGHQGRLVEGHTNPVNPARY
jgi:hypothetical protein